ncbi:MAG: hypothetical protein KF745_05125 [Phycisphaeraceae bacterium]|nr:hypothetical protein [Phycisphaeraceae bacterium]
MLKTLSQFVVRVAELAEAEGRTLRRAVTELCVLSVLLLGIAVLVLAGVGLMLAGAYMGLQAAVGAPWASVIVGAACVALSGGVLWAFRTRLH